MKPKRMKLIPMKVIKYKFGIMECTVNEDGTIQPHGIKSNFEDFVFNDENHLISTWTKRLTKYGKKIIKIYEDGSEVDITPQYED